MTSDASLLRVRIATAAGLLVGALAFFATLFDYRTDLERTAMAPGWFSNFYDLQAQALLAGRLDVPTGSLGIEGFIVDGKTYTYFGPLPSLIRIPILLIDPDAAGRLTLVSMGVGWLLFAGSTAALVWAVRRFYRGDAPLSVFEAILGGVFIAGATGGTILTYDAALPWVYHEAYLWAAATAVGGLYWLLRTVEHPSVRHAVWLGAFGLAAIMARIPAGWAVTGAALITALWLLTPARRRRHGNLWGVFFLSGIVPLVSGIAYNMTRFGHPWLFPLDKQVWTEVNEQRQRALEVNDGTLTGLQFVPTTLMNYFRPDGIRFVDHFPWITLPAEPAQAFAGAYVDQVYRTGSVVSFMPLLFLLSVLALVTLLQFCRNRHLLPLLWVFLGGVGVSSGVMAYGYLSTRYVSDFVPGVVVGGSIGIWALSALVRRRGAAMRTVTVAMVGALASFGIVANMATGLEIARYTWRGQPLINYLELQLKTSDPSSLRQRILRGEDHPTEHVGSTDDLFVVDDCEALYIHSGDLYEPWILVEQRPHVVELTLRDEVRTGRRTLGVVEGRESRELVVETRAPRDLRLMVIDGGMEFPGPWVTPYRGESVRVGIGVDTTTGYARVSTTPGGYVGSVPWVEWGTDWQSRPSSFDWTVPVGHDSRTGITVSAAEGRTPSFCTKLLSTATQ